MVFLATSGLGEWEGWAPAPAGVRPVSASLCGLPASRLSAPALSPFVVCTLALPPPCARASLVLSCSRRRHIVPVPYSPLFSAVSVVFLLRRLVIHRLPPVLLLLLCGLFSRSHPTLIFVAMLFGGSAAVHRCAVSERARSSPSPRCVKKRHWTVSVKIRTYSVNTQWGNANGPGYG